MNQFDLWLPSIEKHIEGKDIVFGSELAKAVGRSCSTMDRHDWATIAAIAKAIGLKKAKANGANYWVAPAAAPQLNIQGSP